MRIALTYGDALFRVAHRLCGHRGDAEDLVQETYYQALRGRSSLRDASKLRAWLFRILRNTWSHNQARRGRTQEVAADPALLDEHVGALVEMPTTLVGDCSDDVDAALRALPEGWRSTLVLVDVEGFAYDEAAEVLGCPVGTVRSRLARARAQLAAELAHMRPPRTSLQRGTP